MLLITCRASTIHVLGAIQSLSDCRSYKSVRSRVIPLVDCRMIDCCAAREKKKILYKNSKLIFVSFDDDIVYIYVFVSERDRGEKRQRKTRERENEFDSVHSCERSYVCTMKIQTFSVLFVCAVGYRCALCGAEKKRKLINDPIHA